MKTEQVRSYYRQFSQLVRSQLSQEEIHAYWAQCSLGKPVGEKTFKRWLRGWPKTKNTRFDPFIVQLAQLICIEGQRQSEVLLKHYKLNGLDDDPHWASFDIRIQKLKKTINLKGSLTDGDDLRREGFVKQIVARVKNLIT